MQATSGGAAQAPPPAPPSEDELIARALPAPTPLLCFRSFSDTPASRRLHRALRYLATPLRRAQAAAERHLAPNTLAARRLRARKFSFRQRHRAAAAADSSATELTAQGSATDDERSATHEAPPAAAEREVLLNAARHHAELFLLSGGRGVPLWSASAYASNAISTAKYNVLTFLPRFFFEMFSRMAYIYFLVQTALAWWPAVSPFDPWGATLALGFVLLVSAIKALVEDSKRHREDWKTNARPTRVMCGDGAFREVQWRAVRVGDVVMVRDDEEVPADLLCVYAALPERVCYVQTTNLDGETNLKVRSPVLLTNTPAAHLAPRTPSEVARLRGRVVCEAPNANLHHFHGRLDVFSPPSPGDDASDVDTRYRLDSFPVPAAGGRHDTEPVAADVNDTPASAAAHASAQTPRWRSLLAAALPGRASSTHAASCAVPLLASIPLSKDDVLFRGCKLKNSKYILGVALYTGHDTRIMKNARRAPFKTGAFDRFLNIEITVLILVQAALCVGMAIGSVQWRDAHRSHWYFEWSEHTGNNYASDVVYGVFNFLTFWVLFSYLVPISLFVSMEIVKFMQGAIFVNHDQRMRDPATGEYALARNTNLNEDLGMVEYAFCDKTGTLTSNEMRLRLLVLDGEVYGRPTFELERCGLPPHAALRAFDARLAAALLDSSSGEEAAAAASGGAGEGEDGAGGGDTSAVPEITSSLQCAAVEAFTALTVCHTLIVEERSSAVAPPKPAAAADDSSAASSSSSSSPPACTAAAAEPPPGADGASAVFQGPSPDEVALVGGAAALGVRFHARSASDVVVDFLGVPLSFEVLAVLEFSSERQRMSVVARRPDGRVTLFCKGADAALLPLLAPPRSAREADVRARTEEHLHELSVLGLRTLVLASRDLDDAEWCAWDARHQAALASQSERREALVVAEVERNLRLVGVTGVEDKLQEGVADTIRTLLAARIRVWTITGDKQETAITVGVASGLLRSPETVLLLNAGTLSDTAQRIQELQALTRAAEKAEAPQSVHAAAGVAGVLAGNGARGPELVVDGGTLMHVLSDPSLARAFAALGAGARAVVVCRASPRQKSAVVKLMQRYLHSDEAARQPGGAARGSIVWHPSRWPAALRRIHHRPSGRTLAIGDGANDVAMLQAADVGVGIAGKEGRQAVNNADFAISQFRFLTRLLLVHGTLSQYRLARLVKYSFYKNICFAGLLLYFQFYAGFSGQALYDSISAGLYNVVLTSLPVIAFSLLDRPVSDAALVAHPQLYNSSTSLTGRAFWKTILDAHVHSVIAFFFSLYAVPQTGGPGSLAGMLAVGKVAYTAVLLIVSVEIVLVSRFITVIFAVLVFLSVAVWFPLLWLIPLIADVNEMIGMASLLFASPVFWLTIVLCAATGLAYRLAWVAGSRYVRPSDMDILTEAEALASAQQRQSTTQPRGDGTCCCMRTRAPAAGPRVGDASPLAREEAEVVPMSAHAADGV